MTCKFIQASYIPRHLSVGTISVVVHLVLKLLVRNLELVHSLLKRSHLVAQVANLGVRNLDRLQRDRAHWDLELWLPDHCEHTEFERERQDQLVGLSVLHKTALRDLVRVAEAALEDLAPRT